MIKMLILDTNNPCVSLHKTLEIDEKYYDQDEFDTYLEKYVQMLIERKEQDDEEREKEFNPGEFVFFVGNCSLLNLKIRRHKSLIISKHYNTDSKQNYYIIAVSINGDLEKVYCSEKDLEPIE